MSEIFCANGGIQSGQVWVSFRGNTKMAESKIDKFKMAKFKMAAIIKLGENKWVWVRLNWFESESDWSEIVFEWIWEKITKVSESNMYKMPEYKMAEFKMAEYKMAAIIKLFRMNSLSQSHSGVRVFLSESERR